METSTMLVAGATGLLGNEICRLLRLKTYNKFTTQYFFVNNYLKEESENPIKEYEILNINDISGTTYY